MKMVRTPVPFVKMSGTGNDFILIDHRKPLLPREKMSEFARLVCRRRFSVGADGLIFIEPSAAADFKWQFFNADGSAAEMCGNGARCAARFAYICGIAPAHMRFETVAGIIEANVADVNVSILMTEPRDFLLHRTVRLRDRIVALHSVDTGVPHAVVFVDKYDGLDVIETGRAIRFHDDFMPAGTNVNFVRRLENGTLHVRTYERGVEGETLACGTGAAASALIAAALGQVEPPVDIITSGGGRLSILFDLREDPAAANVFLKGPAHIIYWGELNAEALLEG